MNIKNDTIEFTSVSNMFYKECGGIKPNTTKFMNCFEHYHMLKANLSKIKITKVGTNLNFTREIEDISHRSLIGVYLYMYTFSW